MKTEMKYKGYKLVTYKNRDGGYTTFVFDGVSVKAVDEVSYKFKKDCISIAKIRIDDLG